MKNLTGITLLALLCVSCTVEMAEPESTPQGEKDKTLSSVTFEIKGSPPSRSCISPDEDLIKDINIYAYRDGILENRIYSSDGKDMVMSLPRGYKYNFYALANVSEKTAPTRESDIGDAIRLTIAQIGDLSEGIPMACKNKGISLSSSTRTIGLSMERLAARIGFSVDSSLLSGLTVTSVTLCQSAAFVWPFAEGGSKVRSSTETITGDKASSDDLARVNEGESIFFYTLENRQGVLLPGNTDPWNKVPDSLDNEANLCTYIEVECEFEEGFLYSGKVTYRFYLGLDNATDFSIVRNSDMSVMMYLTTEGLNEISWKVEPDVELQEGFAYGYLDEGLHEIDDLYIGEKFWYYVEVAADLVTHLGGDLTKCSVKMLSQDGGTIRFDSYDTNSEGGYMYVRGTCTSKGTGNLWICDPYGNPVAQVGSGFNIQKPQMVVSFYSRVDYGETDFAVDEPPCSIINGQDEQLHVYLTDRAGHNLNNDYLSGFDLSLFSFENDPYWESDYAIYENISITMTPGTSESNGPAATYTISCRNDGHSSEVNHDLSNAVQDMTALTFDIDENNHQISDRCSVGLDFQKITLTVVDNGWADYFDCQLALKVNNPSNMPLVILGWQVNTSNGDWNAISRNQFLDDVQNNIDITRASYITNSYYDNDVPLYGNNIIIYSERNSEGDQYTSDGNLMVYPLEGISTDDVYRVQMCDKKGQESLHHLFDVRMGSARLYSSKVSVVDNLEDGSMTYSIIYGDDPENPGWNNKGMWLYSNGTLLSKANTSLDSFNNITPQKLYNLMSRYDTTGPYALKLTYDSSEGQLYASCTKGNPYGIKLDVSITGTVSGYVETFPNGTWGSGKDNYCSAIINKTVTGISVGTSNTSIDGGAIKAGMDAIYAQTFYDSHNMIGSANNFQHAAHPTAVNVTIKIKVNSASGSELYPITLTWSDTSLAYYHTQDKKTYTPSLTKSNTNYDFIRLKRK